MKQVLTCLVICTKQEQIYTAIWHSLLFVQKSKILGGWVDGIIDVEPVSGLLTAIKKKYVKQKMIFKSIEKSISNQIKK